MICFSSQPVKFSREVSVATEDDDLEEWVKKAHFFGRMREVIFVVLQGILPECNASQNGSCEEHRVQLSALLIVSEKYILDRVKCFGHLPREVVHTE